MLVEYELTPKYNLSSDSTILINAIGTKSSEPKAKYFPKTVKKFLRNLRVINPSIMKNVLRLKNNPIKNRLAVMTGYKIKFGGRLSNQKVVPKRTTNTYNSGTLNRVKTDLVTKSRYSARSKRGAFSITITMGHKFF